MGSERDYAARFVPCIDLQPFRIAAGIIVYCSLVLLRLTDLQYTNPTFKASTAEYSGDVH